MPPDGQISPNISYAHSMGSIEQAHHPFSCAWAPESARIGKLSKAQAQAQARSHEDRSITAIQFLPEGKDHLLLTASNLSAAVKLWDIRAVGSLRQKQVQALS